MQKAIYLEERANKMPSSIAADSNVVKKGQKPGTSVANIQGIRKQYFASNSIWPQTCVLCQNAPDLGMDTEKKH